MDAMALGFAAAPVCLSFCGPALLPLVASRAQATWTAGAKAVAAFLAGRLLSYGVTGLIAGRLGQFVLASEARLALSAALIVAALYLVFYGLAVSRPPSEDEPRKPCLAMRLTTSSRGPFLVGMLAGISFCPPFYLAAAAAARMGGALNGLLYFLAFFVGTSVFMLPLAALPRLAARLDRVRLRRAGAGLALIVGFCMALQAARDMAHPFAPPAEPVAIAAPGAPASQPAAWPKPAEEQLRQAFPGADRFEFAAEPSAHYKALSAPPQSKLMGYAFVCQDFIDPGQREQTHGYGGVVPVVVGVDLQGRITGVVMLANDETPEFAGKASHPNFLSRFKGRPASAAHAESGEDAVTGATFTSRAVANAVRLGARGFHEAVLAAAAASNPAPGATSAPWISSRDLVYLAVLAAGIAAMILAPSKRAELILGLVVVAGLGFWLRRFFSVDDVLRLALRAAPAWTWTVAAVLAITVLFGRVFCRLFCPFGMLQDLLWLPLRVRARPPLALDRGLRWAPAGLLWVAGAACAVTGRLPAAHVEPFAATFSLTSLDAAADLARQNPLMMGLIVLCLAAGVVFRRFWCLYLCPAGAALKVMSRLRLLRPVVNARCARCPRPSGEEIICPGCAAARAPRWERLHEPRDNGQ